MTALPIDPSRAELHHIVANRPAGTNAFVVAFQAGVEAERARAAAEATEEWGVAPVDKPHRGEPFRSRDAAVRAAAWANGRRPSSPLVGLVRRLVGPWEVQS